MKKNTTTLLIIAIVLLSTLLIFVGCSDMMEKLGCIDLTIDLDTPDVEVASYLLEGSLSNTSSRFSLNDIMPPRHTLSNLKKGTWDLKVTAFDASDNQIGVGTKTVELKEGQIADISLLIVFSQRAPQLGSFIITAPARHDVAQGTITGTTTNMEYKLASASQEAAYTPCSASATLLAPGTYKIRYAQAHGLEASEDLMVTVPAYQPIRLTVTGTEVDTSKEYDGLATAEVLSPGALGGIVGSDQVSVTATAAYRDAKAGTGKQITVSYSLEGADKDHYLPPVADTSLNGQITRKPLTVSYATTPEPSKVYDGTRVAQLATAGTLNGVLSGDEVNLQATATFIDKNVDTAKLVTINYNLSGADADNYAAPQESTFNTGVITKRQLTATVGTYTKTYGQGNPSFIVNVSGFVNGEDASTAENYLAPTAVSSADAGTAAGTSTITLSGGSATNYSFNTSDTGTLIINKAVYDMSAVSFNDATVTYDGTEQSILTTGTLPTGVRVAYSDNTNTNAGTYTITAHFTGDSTNYEAIADKTASLTITKRNLIASNISVTATKVYDASAAATITNCDISGIVDGDAVTVVKNASFDTVQAGTGKSISVTFDLEGTDKANYTKPSDRVVSTNGEITRKQLSVSDTVYNTTKVYDGTTDLPITSDGTLQAVLEGSSVTLSSVVGSYADADAGDRAYTIRYTLGGTDAGNYTIPDITGTGTISKATISGTVSISGTATYGQVLTANASLTNAGTPTYQWKRGGAAISGATGTTYTLVKEDIDTYITVTVTAGGSNYQGSITSYQTAKVRKASGPAFDGSAISAYFPSSPDNQKIINLTGFTPNQTGIEVVYSYDGFLIGSESIATLEVDSRGRAMILTNSFVTTSGAVKLRYTETETTYTGNFTDIPITAEPLAIGDYYEGGIVAYVYSAENEPALYVADEVHGLIAAKSDMSLSGNEWTNLNTSLLIGTQIDLGTGSDNTDVIIATLDANGESGMSYAAKKARSYTDGIYHDWFLPSWDELKKLYAGKIEIGNFNTTYGTAYMTSSESTQRDYEPDSYFHVVFFDSRNPDMYLVFTKLNGAANIRPVRYF